MPRCRICQADESNQEIRADFVYGGNDEHRFWHCRTCDAVYLYPIPSEEEEARFYRQEFESFMSGRSANDRDWSSAEAHVKSNQDQVKRRWPFLDPYLKEGAELLEIGCSSGFMLDAIRETGATCTGVEPSGAFTEYLREKGYSVFNDLSELVTENSGQRFDLIIHFFVFEHIRDPFDFLNQTVNLLKPGGRIIAEIPCVNDPLASLYDIPAFHRFYWSVAHHYYYSPKCLEYILDRLGLKFQLIPEQRYDLSNHMTWAMDGKPGGQGRYDDVFSEELKDVYRNDLIKSWNCDTIFMIIEN